MHDIILYGEPYELNHYMLNRLLKRAGIDKARLRLVPLYDPKLFTYPEKVIVTLGDKALEHIIGERDSFRWFNRVTPLKIGKFLIPNLLPSSLLPFKDYDADSEEDGKRHPPRLHGIVMASFRKALEWASGEKEVVCPEYYTLDPTPLGFKEWVKDYQNAGFPALAFDIETSYSIRKHSEENFDESEFDKEILRISFSYKSHYAVSIPFSAEYFPSIRELLENDAVKVVWNGRTFDKRVLEYNGFRVNGTIFDAMDAWHLLQSDLEKGLEFVSGIYTNIRPWKHLNNAQPAYYSCVDADATIQIYFTILKELEERSLLDAFDTLATKCMYYLDRAGQRGNYIDLERQGALRVLLTEKKRELLSEIQLLVPNNLKPTTTYKKPPGDRPYTITHVVGKIKCCELCKQPISSKSEHQKGKGNLCKGAGTIIMDGLVPMYQVAEDFNPNSSLQVINYIKHYNHPLGKNHKTKNETADTKHLKKLVGKYGKTHPVYTKIIEIHKVSKALSTYVEGLKPDSTGRVYSTYVNAPSTWRLSSRNVNMQNQGKRESNPYAKEARRTIIAPEGFSFVQADSSSIEAVLVGYFMNDPHYIELAKQSIHAYLCCMWLGWEFTSDNVKRIKSEYKELYEQLKRVNHGTNFGMGPRLMYANDPEIFKSLKEAKRCQDFLFEQLPGLKKWHHEVRTRAQKEGYLQNPFGVRHYFYDVFSYQLTPGGSVIYGNDGLPKIKLGKDAKRAIAFLPQSTAGCFARQNIVIIGESPYEPYMPANITVHDGYTLCVPDNLVDNAARFLYTTLTRPIPELGGLSIGCEVEVGKNWGEMEKYKL